MIFFKPACHTRAWRLLQRRRYVNNIHRELEDRQRAERRARAAREKEATQ